MTGEEGPVREAGPQHVPLLHLVPPSHRRRSSDMLNKHSSLLSLSFCCSDRRVSREPALQRRGWGVWGTAPSFAELQIMCYDEAYQGFSVSLNLIAKFTDETC